jgi:DNA-binding NtrC family response regulator
MIKAYTARAATQITGDAPHRKRILLVESDTSVRAALIRLLQSENHEVMSARDAAEACHLPDVDNLDAILFDLDTADESCLQTLRMLANTNPHARVLLTTTCKQQPFDPSMTAGIVMEKPFHLPDLLRQLKQPAEPASRLTARAATSN